ncbi:bacteriophage mu T protein [Glaesserella parasuis]|nr:bacteriophage mu T protein [Glaesserella parasuis]
MTGRTFLTLTTLFIRMWTGTGVAKQQSNVTTGSASGQPAFYILDDTNAIKPLIWQERTKPEIEAKFDPSKSDKVFMEDVYLWGVRARGNCWLWFLATDSPCGIV